MEYAPMASVNTILAADGTPLRKKLAQSLFRSRLRAFGLVLPLLALIISSFVIPIMSMLSQSVVDERFSSLMPTITEELLTWDGYSEPTEAMAAALVSDLVTARKNRTIGQVATRVNRELSGSRSLFTSTARSANKFKPPYIAALTKKD
jgi:putative spermidine/putrescine transport system permease protein